MYDSLTESFRKMAQTQRSALRSELAKYGLYLGQHRILFLLKEKPNISQVEICDELSVTKESLSLSMKRLAHAELVESVKDAQDKRKTLWSLTELGTLKARECKHGFETVNAAMFQNFSDEERALLEAFFKQMILGLESRNL